MSNTPQENPYYRPVHRERAKLKIPGFGGGSTSGSGKRTREKRSDTDIYVKLLPLIIVAIVGYGIYDTLAAFKGKKRNLIDDPQTIQEMTWKQEKVFKKYADLSPRSQHYYLVIGQEGHTKTIDFGREKTEFWDKVDPFNHLTKAPGSLNVSIDAYDNSRDQVVTMKFE
ncbi:hypothetical protein [Siphonobacter curvatus]|uniref:Uncharacterized protein n=1 Tax=Siphonobacter curvatus TaxID=2094562 RepID=A0A2S7IP08_9BACT|nr:hypothetical protein [Siphonobacter curvatus]PQA59300.1 hypothetical protein C5O19_06515 [Siphonobacter curvatus]